MPLFCYIRPTLCPTFRGEQGSGRRAGTGTWGVIPRFYALELATISKLLNSKYLIAIVEYYISV